VRNDPAITGLETAAGSEAVIQTLALVVPTFCLSGFGSPLCRRCNSHRIRTFGRSKRGGYKCSRTEIQKPAYAEEETGDETEIDQSFA
jgi:hypothetical protein